MNVSQSLKMSFSKSLAGIKISKSMLYMVVFILALIAFEAFNYSTTDFALTGLLGDLQFVGIRWATLLALAFCGIDFAGITRLLAPQYEQKDSVISTWFMFSAWVLAATMNAILTWWGIVLAIQTHPMMSTGFVDPKFVTTTLPIMIALLVWVIRILLVGTLSKKSEQVSAKNKQSVPSTMSRREFRQAQSFVAQQNKDQTRTQQATFMPRAASKRNNHPDPQYIPMQDEMAYH